MHPHKNLRKIREDKRVSQEYMAAKLGITQQAYSDIENGKIELTPERAGQCAEILGVDISEIYKNAEADNTEVVYLKKIIEEKDKVIEAKEEVIKAKDEIILLLQNPPEDKNGKKDND